MKKILLIVIATAVGVTGWIMWWREHLELGRATSAAAHTEDTINQLRKQVWQARDQAKETVSFAPFADPDATPSAKGPVQHMVNEWLALMNNPEAQRLMALQQKAQISTRYAGMFRALGLNPEQLTKFKTLLQERQASDNDIMAVALQKGIDPMQNPQEFAKLTLGVHQEYETQIQAALGAEKYSQLQTYQASQRDRSLIHQLQESLSYTPDTLSREQGDQLQQIVADTGPNRAANGGPPGTLTDATMTRAKDILKPAQMDALEEIRQAQLATRQLENIKQESSPLAAKK